MTMAAAADGLTKVTVVPLSCLSRRLSGHVSGEVVISCESVGWSDARKTIVSCKADASVSVVYCLSAVEIV